MSGNGAICITCGKRPPRYGSVRCLTCSLAAIEKDPKENRVGVAPTMEEAREEIRRRNGMPTKTKPQKEAAPGPPKEKYKFCKGCGRHKKDVGRFYKGFCAECRSKPEAEPGPHRAPETEDIPASAATPFDHLKGQRIDPEIGKAILEGMREAELRITLDFKAHPELLKRLTALATKEFRSPEGQAMAIIDLVLRGEKDV